MCMHFHCKAVGPELFALMQTLCDHQRFSVHGCRSAQCMHGSRHLHLRVMFRCVYGFWNVAPSCWVSYHSHGKVWWGAEGALDFLPFLKLQQAM